MKIDFLRSSSISTWESYCQQKYYIIYVLGQEDKQNFKTVKGTICHFVLEALAGMKRSFQNKGVYQYEHPSIGIYRCSENDFFKEYLLKNEEVDFINYSRSDKKIFMDQIKVNYGHKRYGVSLVEYLVNKGYDYYSSRFDHPWTEIDKRDCLNWVWMVLDWDNGHYDPRKRNIVYPELPFNIELKKDWAKLPTGGYLKIKGTIDLVTSVDDGVLEICDWKFGQRLDWGKNKVKTYEDLMKDPQLMLYYYAARKSLPDYEAIMITIFWARSGGPFTLVFDDSILETVEKNLRKTFEEIKDCKNPKLRDYQHKDFQCNKLCGFYKQKVGNMNFCHKIANDIRVYGIDECTKRNTKEGFDVSIYNAPGE